MEPVKPVYIKLLIAVIVLWVITLTYCITDIYLVIGKIEHDLVHMTSGQHGH